MDNADILAEIFGWIDAGSTYKAIALTSRLFRDIVVAVHPTADTKFANHLLTLLKLYPDADWNYCHLSCNPNITMDYVQAHPDKKWNTYFLSLNPATKDDFPKWTTRSPHNYWFVPVEIWLRAEPADWNTIKNNAGYHILDFLRRPDPTITWKMVRGNHILQDFGLLSRNTFGKD